MNTNSRLSQLSCDAAEAAVARAVSFVKDGNAVWCPVFADVIDSNDKIVGHIVSDGYTHNDWDFNPINRKLGRGDTYADRRAQDEAQKTNPIKLHRRTRNLRFDVCVPRWVGNYTLKNVLTYNEKRG
jgi:hypothetical protein